MELRPIYSALMRNKAGLALIVIQVAITLAVICNSLFIVLERSARVARTSGIDETGTFTVDSLGFVAGYDVRDAQLRDLAMLRALPGVIDATSTNTVPMSNGGWGTGLSLQPEPPGGQGGDDGDSESAALYLVDEHALDAFGVRLIEGRAFRAEDVADFAQESGIVADSIIVTQALAKALFPDESAVGKQVYGIGNNNRVVTIVGVIEHMQQPWIGSRNIDQSALVPTRQIDGNYARYLIRAEPGQRERVMKEAEKMLQDSNSGRLIRRVRSLEEVRESGYRQDHAMMSILTGTMLAMMIITGMGIVGLTSFWVTRRIKQIGTRRALGARRFNIRSYFRTENGLMIAFGIVLGAVLTYGFNAWLMRTFDAERLPWFYLPLGAVVMLLLGQLAVLGPAARAAAVPPALATRTA